MKRISRTELLMLSISLACHALAYTFYSLRSDRFGLPVQWSVQFLVLLLVSVTLSVLLPYMNRAFLIFIIFAVKILVLILVGVPLGSYLIVEVILVIPFLFEGLTYFSFQTGILVGLLSIVLVSLNQGAMKVWDREISPAELHDLIFFGSIAGLFLLLGAFVKYLSTLAQSQRAEIQRLDNALEKISRVNLDYQNYANIIERESEERERKRISREIHDIIGYTLTNQLMIIQAALSYTDRDRTRLNNLLLKAQNQINDSLQEARNALRRLRAIESTRERGANLFLKLTKTFEEITRVQVQIDFANLSSTLDSQVEKTIYRLLQEGMTNAFRHGKATRIKILFWCNARHIQVSIEDNGIGTTVITEGIGIKGMRERIEQQGGSLEANATPQGFALRAKVPLFPPEQHHV